MIGILYIAVALPLFLALKEIWRENQDVYVNLRRIKPFKTTRTFTVRYHMDEIGELLGSAGSVDGIAYEYDREDSVLILKYQFHQQEYVLSLEKDSGSEDYILSVTTSGILKEGTLFNMVNRFFIKALDAVPVAYPRKR